MDKVEEMRNALLRRLKQDVLKKKRAAEKLLNNFQVPWENVEKALRIYFFTQVEFNNIVGKPLFYCWSDEELKQ